MRIEKSLSSHTLGRRAKECIGVHSFDMKRIVGRWSRGRLLNQRRWYIINFLLGGRVIFGMSRKCDVILL
jgi:hypothetical protein